MVLVVVELSHKEMNLVAKVLVENPGVVVLRNKNGSDWDVFKLQFDNDSSSLSADPQSSFICFACDDQEFISYQSLSHHCHQYSHRDNEEEFVRRIHGHEMKMKSEIAAKSPIKSCHQLQDQDQYHSCYWYGVQYMLQFMPGDYDYENLPIYVCTLCYWRGYARELAAHFEDLTHVRGYLHVNNCKELDLEIAKELFDYDTEFRYQSCILEKFVCNETKRCFIFQQAF